MKNKSELIYFQQSRSTPVDGCGEMKLMLITEDETDGAICRTFEVLRCICVVEPNNIVPYKLSISHINQLHHRLRISTNEQ